MTANANIAARLSELVARHPERLAILETRGRREQRVTFAELEARVDAYAADWRARGIGAGDRLLVFVPMSIALYAVLLAAFRVGAVAVFVDAWADRRRLESAIARTQPVAFVGIPRAHLLRLTSGAVRRIPHAIVIGTRVPRPAVSRVAPESLPPEAAALVTFTTGSTGRPKAAERSHGYLWSQHRALAAHLAPREGDIDMPTLPVFVLNNLASGIPSVLPDFDPRRPGDIDPVAILAQMRRTGVTTSSGSPVFYERLADHVLAHGGTLPLRVLHTGGAPVLPALAARLERVAPCAQVVYGSTEAEPIAAIEVRELLAAMTADTATSPGLCVGAPVPEVQCRLVRAHDGPIALAPAGWGEWEVAAHEVGEIVVCGDHVLRSYLDDPESVRANKIADGDRVWHRTGDAARWDDSGRLWLMGRVRERVRRSGETWWPLPVEVRALQQPGVRHAAYLALPDPVRGQRAVLCVEHAGGALAPEDEAALRSAVGAPVDELRVFTHLPRDPRHASKTDLEALRARLTR